MQQSFLAIFCDECGLANAPTATSCTACQHPLTPPRTTTSSAASASSVLITPQPVREATVGLLFQASEHSAPDEIGPGTILAGTYRIEAEIGRGGFAIVYRASELDNPRHQVAIKRIPLSQLTPAQIIDATQTFNREVTILKEFTGTRGIPRFYGHLTDQANWYLVMQYIPGETLEEKLQKTPNGYLSEATTINLGIVLTDILFELHTHEPPIIFRDVKPANIMLTPDGELYLIDFGIARTYTWGKSRDTTPLGSPGYAAPEQYGHGQTSQNTDIYGLGATLQTLVTGRDPQELAAGEISRNPQPPSPALRSLLTAMLSEDRWQRPLNMRRVQEQLKSIKPPAMETPVSSPLNGDKQLLFIFSLLLGAIAFIAFSVLALWLGLFFLVNLILTCCFVMPWAAKLPRIGQFLARKRALILIFLWYAFTLTLMVFFIFRLVPPAG